MSELDKFAVQRMRWAMERSAVRTSEAEAEVVSLRKRLAAAEAERDRALVALWRIRMEAERATVDEPVWQLPNTIIHLALGGMGSYKREAQRLAAGGVSDA